MPTFDFEGGSISSDFLNDDDFPWAIQTGNPYAGTYGIQADSGNDREASAIILVGDFAAGDVTFREEISSEGSWDFGVFRVDDEDPPSLDISGTPGSFTLRTVAITAGTHGLVWAFCKDNSASGGNDTWYLDDITVPSYTLTPIAADGEQFSGGVPAGSEWTNDATYPWESSTRGIDSTGSVVSDQSPVTGQDSDLEYNSDSGASAGDAVVIYVVDSEVAELGKVIVDTTTESQQDGYGIKAAGWADQYAPFVVPITVTSGTHEYIFRYENAGSASGKDEMQVFAFYEPGMTAAAGGPPLTTRRQMDGGMNQIIGGMQ